MVGYVHDSTTTWKAWDREFSTVRTQPDVVFDEERNAHVSCPESPSQEADPLGLPPEEVHVEVLDTENMEHGYSSRGKRGSHHHHHHHEDQSIAGKHRIFITENGCPNGGGKGHGIIESRGDDARSVAARGRVSKAAERRGLAIENARIPEA